MLCYALPEIRFRVQRRVRYFTNGQIYEWATEAIRGDLGLGSGYGLGTGLGLGLGYGFGCINSAFWQKSSFLHNFGLFLAVFGTFFFMFFSILFGICGLFNLSIGFQGRLRHI